MVPYRSRSRNKGSGPNYIDIVIPGDTTAKEKEHEKNEKYEPLKEEVGKAAEEGGGGGMGRMKKAEVIPVVQLHCNWFKSRSSLDFFFSFLCN